MNFPKFSWLLPRKIFADAPPPTNSSLRDLARWPDNDATLRAIFELSYLRWQVTNQKALCPNLTDCERAWWAGRAYEAMEFIQEFELRRSQGKTEAAGAVTKA
jgi:hypothetical protein